MANLKDIRNRIKSVKSIQQVTKAMKMVAAAKMRRAQENMEQARPYTFKMEDMLNNLVSEFNSDLIPVLETRSEVKKKLFVIVTADRGMAGAFNTNIIKTAHKAIDELGKDNSVLLCIGKKAHTYFKNRNYDIKKYYIDFWSDLKYQDAIDICNYIKKQFLDFSVDQVEIVYNEFVNVGRQEVKNKIFLPLENKSKNEKSNEMSDRIFEPSKEIVLKTLVPKYLNTQIWQFLLESYASEQAARMLAMENATSNAQDMIKDLTLQFNKARQTAITTEMLEIVSGAEALS